MTYAASEPDHDPPGAAATAAVLDLPQRFAYHRSVAPLLWMLVVIGSIELAVTHLLVALWSRPVALAVSAVTLAALAWLVRALLMMKRRPVLLDHARLVMQVGTIRRVDIPRDAIAGLRPSLPAAALKQRSTLNLALLAYPNVVVDLRRPLPGRRGIVTIAHRLDDPAAFVAAWKALGAQR
ncbi:MULTISPECIES: hypothetical protein [unclassified Sphingomonas]|uniref:hypothetical protein n=1 Tax=unclassified Sphingomonas TaxID=196159 RepID=UPI00044F53EF|nr:MULTISPECIES: hypothetical protein [unclassified Sphingomonas]EZP57533.1 hypothetical protein BW41_00381 [Sphingomonas sp. RIT328]